MTSTIKIQDHVKQHQFQEVAELYCDALHDKLTPFLGSPKRAARVLVQGLVADRAILAIREDQVVGVCGLATDDGDMFDPGLTPFLKEYGWTGLIRAAGLVLLVRKPPKGCLMLDGLAVAKNARGQGIGTKLLDAVEEKATHLGKTQLRLDVIDTNDDARRLYERRGFVARKTTKLGLARHLFNFSASTEMRKVLASNEN